jgi:FlaA1/EpsC-like NDP-sugar epimerase
MNATNGVSADQLLDARPVHLNRHPIEARIQGKVVMVTGAAGSIGSELCRQIAGFKPQAVVAFDQAETPLFFLEREMAATFPTLAFHAEIGTITRPENLDRVMRRYQPSILFHAAAYKHVPILEKNVFAAVENNIFGTWHVALAAIKHRVEDFVLISTDKAVQPSSVMGATKRVAELIVRAFRQDRGAIFITVRFGNVLESSGSVVPIFREQIAAGGPVTVTHPDMRRYFMTITESAQLILQAFSIGAGGELFVLDMGEPIKIVDLARKLIRLSGLDPDRDIETQFTGLRPGEKLCEELSLLDEQLHSTSHPRIRSHSPASGIGRSQLTEALAGLQDAIDAQDASRLVILMKELVPNYNPDTRLVEKALSVR